MQPPASKFYQAALAFAANGIPVFPCVAGGKQPAVEHGHKDATTDPAQLERWWAANPDYNPAICPEDAGWCIVDLDPGSDRASLDLPPTYEVQTPRGGFHLYYKGSLPPTAHKLGPKIDTRGRNSYILIPPSIVNGKAYGVIHDRELAQLPDTIAARLAVTDRAAKASVAELDLGGNVARARTLLADYVRRGDVARQGHGGDDRTYRLACEVANLGLSPAVALDLICEIWNPHCIPPWTRDELSVKIENAGQYAQNEAGAFAVAPAAEVFGEALEAVPEVDQPRGRSRFYFEDDAEQDLAPDPEWLIPELIPDRATVLVLGVTASFKTFLMQDILLAVAAGKETFGVLPKRFGPTFYGAHEARDDIRKSRKQAWKLAHEIDAQIPFFVARGPHIIADDECAEFREQIRVRLRQSVKKIGAVVIDTVAKSMVGLNENDAGDTGRFIAFCDSLRDEFECPVIALHHYGKDEGRGGRGSSALQSGFDTTLAVRRTPHTKLVSVQVIQHANAPEREEPFTFEGRPFANSLVFQPITATEHKTLIGKDDTYTGPKIGAALKELKAAGVEQGVSTTVLATALVPPDELETDEDRQAAVEKTARALATLARTKLEPYCVKRGRALVWFLPAS